MASSPEKVTVKGVEVYRVRWRYEGIWQQVIETFRADAQRASDFVTNLRNKIKATDDLITGRAYLVGSVEAREVAGRARSFGWAFEQLCTYKTNRWADDTAEGYRRSVRIHLADWLGRPVGTLRAADLNTRYHELLATDLAYNTVIRVMATAKTALTFAHGNGWTKYNPHSIDPADRLDFIVKPDDTTTREAITQKTFRTLLTFIDDEQARAAVMVMAMMGARLGEVFALRKGDVDLHRRTMLIRGTMKCTKRQARTKAERKGSRPMKYRPLPIPPELVMILRPFVVGDPDEPLFVHVGARGRVNAHWHPGTWRNRHWYPMVRAARAAGVVLPEEMVPHVLRHSMATWLAVHLRPQELMRRMRHASLTMTMRYYHDNEIAEAREFDALDKVFGAYPNDERPGSMAA